MSGAYRLGRLVGTLLLLWLVPTALYAGLYGAVWLYARLTGVRMSEVASRGTLREIVALVTVGLLAGALVFALARRGAREG